MQHLATMMSRARQARRNGRSSRQSPSPEYMCPSRVTKSTMHPNTPEDGDSPYGSSGGSSPIPSSTRTPVSTSPSLINLSPTSNQIGAIHEPSRYCLYLKAILEKFIA